MKVLRVLCSFVMVMLIMVYNAAMANELTIEHRCGSVNSVYGYSYVRLSGEKYTDNGNGTHSYMGIRSAQAYCSECDIVYLESVAAPEVVTAKCRYFQGLCFSCRGENVPCEHEQKNYVYQGDVGSPEYLDENYHWVSAEVKMKCQCQICGAVLLEPYDEYLSAHFFDENGMCECGIEGASSICDMFTDHISREYMEMNHRYQNVNSDTHTEVFDVGSGSYCLRKEMIFSFFKEYENVKRTEPHTFKNGVCACGKQLFDLSKSLMLPSAMTAIESEAFYGNPVHAVFVPSACKSIGSLAFAYCSQLEYIQIPASVTQIAADAFKGCSGLTICSPAGSYAQTYAQEHGFAWMEL